MSLLNLLVMLHVSFLVLMTVRGRYHSARESFENTPTSLLRSEAPRKSKLEALRERVEALEEDFKSSSSLVTYAMETIDTRMKKTETETGKLSARLNTLETDIVPIKKSAEDMNNFMSDVNADIQ